MDGIDGDAEVKMLVTLFTNCNETKYRGLY